jgi:hypothetical protein
MTTEAATRTIMNHPVFGDVVVVKMPTPAIPTTMTTNSSIYFLERKQLTLFVQTQNAQGKYVEGIKRHLDPKSIKEATGLTSLVGVSEIVMDDDPTTRSFPHRLMRFNDAYRRTWGDQPLYGNVFVVLSKTAWNNLPASKQLTDDQVRALTLQPTA